MKTLKDVRPTSGRVLLALFSILGERVRDANFLDLFAGTGRVGLEALARGAASCVFVESVKSRADSIRKRVDSNSALVLSLEVRRALSWLVKRDRKFHVIFADPPYNAGWPETLVALPDFAKVLEPDSVLIIEHSIRENMTLENNPHNLEIISSREYGETCLAFLKLK